jgi:hypothetical protein
MAKLKQVIGAILCDINRARAISDAYSRDLKASYREDPFLKLLDVPRTDIKEMTIDLKFSIKQLKYNTTPILYVNYKEKGVKGLNVNQVEFGTEDERLLGMYRRIGMKTWVSEQISEGQSKVISQFKENGRDEWSVYLDNGTSEDPSLVKNIQIDLHTQKITVRDHEGNELKQDRVLSASADWSENSEIEKDIEDIDVEVVTRELTSLPAATLSSISLKLDLTSV